MTYASALLDLLLIAGIVVAFIPAFVVHWSLALVPIGAAMVLVPIIRASK